MLRELRRSHIGVNDLSFYRLIAMLKRPLLVGKSCKNLLERGVFSEVIPGSLVTGDRSRLSSLLITACKAIFGCGDHLAKITLIKAGD
jgi:hypothetical protein